MSWDALMESRFKTDPWAHQLREFEISADRPSRALLWQMRTGKSKEMVDQACSLYVRGLIDAVMIFAPNGVHENWVEREFPTHAWDCLDDLHQFSWRTRLAGAKGGRGRGKEALALWEDIHAAWHASVRYSMEMPGLLVISFNSESMIREDIRKLVARVRRKRKLLVIFDESSDFRTPGSTRTIMAESLARAVPFRRILDGTVITNSPMAAYSQFELLERGALGFRTFGESTDPVTHVPVPGFSDFFGEWEMVERGKRGGGRGWTRKLVGLKNLPILRERMAVHSSVVLRSDCEDLPELLPRRRKVKLSPEQVRVYHEAERAIRVEIDEGEVATINAKAIRLGKLQQVVGGYLISEDGKVHKIPGLNPRMEAMADEVFWTPGPVIVYAQFQHEIKDIIARLRADGHEVWHYYGGTSDAEKQRIRKEFRLLGDRKVVLVAQCQSAGRGLELPAGLILWYSHTFSGIFRQQGNERATVMGGKGINLVDLVAPGVDYYILDTVSERIDIADDIAGRGLQDLLNRYSLANTEDSDADY